MQCYSQPKNLYRGLKICGQLGRKVLREIYCKMHLQWQHLADMVKSIGLSNEGIPERDISYLV